MVSVTDRDGIIDLLRDLGEPPFLPPSCEDVDDDGRIGLWVIRDRFGSFDDALDAAGYDLDNAIRGQRIPTHELIYDLRLGASLLGHAPSSNEYEAFGEYSMFAMTSRLGPGWADVLESAGLPPTGEPVDFGPDDVTVPAVSVLFAAETGESSATYSTDDHEQPSTTAP